MASKLFGPDGAYSVKTSYYTKAWSAKNSNVVESRGGHRLDIVTKINATMDAQTDKVMRYSLNVIRRAALEMAIGIKATTPIDTGRAKHNWTLGLNGYKKPEYVVYDQEYDQEYNINDSYDLDQLEQMKLGDVITINNSTPYIRELEHGHSRQAPQGMVRINRQLFGSIYFPGARDYIKSGGKWYDQ